MCCRQYQTAPYRNGSFVPPDLNTHEAGKRSHFFKIFLKFFIYQGIALNKPSGKHLGDISDEFEGLEEIEIFSGGPVNETAIGIAVCAKNNTDELGGKFVFGAAPKDAIAELSKDPDARAAAFMGYCGWGAGQLKKEIEEGAWIVMNADMELVFDTPPEFLWRELVLREMPEFDALPPPETSPDLN